MILESVGCVWGLHSFCSLKTDLENCSLVLKTVRVTVVREEISIKKFKTRIQFIRYSCSNKAEPLKNKLLKICFFA